MKTKRKSNIFEYELLDGEEIQPFLVRVRPVLDEWGIESRSICTIWLTACVDRAVYADRAIYRQIRAESQHILCRHEPPDFNNNPAVLDKVPCFFDRHAACIGEICRGRRHRHDQFWNRTTSTLVGAQTRELFQYRHGAFRLYASRLL